MSGFRLLLTVAALLPAATSYANNDIPDYFLMHRYEVVDAKARGAVCNDGSNAAYYVRNCTANGDAKPGDPDFCAKGTQLGGSQLSHLGDPRAWSRGSSKMAVKRCLTLDACRRQH